MRRELDALGSVEVPNEALYGAHTVRALANFPGRWPRVADRPELLVALAQVKAAAAETNVRVGQLNPGIADAIVTAAEEIVEGRWHDQFPLPLIHGGGGTATNMAMNEVLANRAAQLLGGELGTYDLVHPLNHVNGSQSSNDVYPTAIQVAVLACSSKALEGLDGVASALDEIADNYRGLERLGRTCLRDALPVPVAAYHRAQAAAVRRVASAVRDAAIVLHRVPLGATAVGTGLGAPVGYRELAVEKLANRTALPLLPAVDLFDALAHLDPFLSVARATATAAITLAKFAADLRFLSSGPVSGIAEVRLPAVQVGSSMMPGKVNPVIPEFVIQASFVIRGAAESVELAVAAGELDLNVMEPIIALHLSDSLLQLANVAHAFTSGCLNGLEWDEETVVRHLSGSFKGAVEHAAIVGHDAAVSERASQSADQ